MKEMVLELAKYSINRSLAEGFDEAAALVRYRRNTMVKFSNNAITVVQSWSDTKVSIYLAKDQRILVLEDIAGKKEIIDRALKDSRARISFIEPSELYARLPEPSGKPLTDLVDRVLAEEQEKVVDSVYDLIDAGLKEGAERLAGVLYFGYEIKGLATSKGCELVEDKTFVEVYTRAFRGEVSGHWAWTSTRFDKAKIVDVGARAGRYASMTVKAIDIEPGKYSAILSPLVVGNLMNYLARVASAFMAMIGLSIFTKIKPGERIGSEKITIVDDPHDKLLPNATGFDDEGVKTSRKAIVRSGIFETYLHNTKTASRMNTSSTGNAGWINPRPWNIVIEPGDVREEEMVKEVKRGFFVLNNWYTRFQNWIEGQFSTVSRDLLLYIENGEVVGYVKRLRIADTFPNLLKNIVALSRDAYDIMWWEVDIPTRAPFIYIEKTMFTKPEI